MRFLLKQTGIILLMLIICRALCGCTIKDKASIVGTIHDFEQSCNEMDLDGMLECIEPTVADIIRILPIPRTEEGLRDFLVKTTDIISIFDVTLGEDIFDYFESIKIDIRNIEVEGRRAVVDAKWSYKIDGERIKEDITVRLSERGGKWYITFLS